MGFKQFFERQHDLEFVSFRRNTTYYTGATTKSISMIGYIDAENGIIIPTPNNWEKLTRDKTVITDFRNYSIPCRQKLVISKDLSLRSAIFEAKEDIVIIANADLYNKVLEENIIDTIYLKQLYNSYDCDTCVKPIPKHFKVISQKDYELYRFKILKK